MVLLQALLYTKQMKSADYCQGDAFQVEKRTIFSGSWLPVGAGGQIARPGSYLSVSVGGWGVVAVRGEDATVRVLRNACRHQNMPVVNAGTGNCANFRCRFHGWSYGLDGKFQSAPPPMAPLPTQTDRDLLALATASTGGMVFFSTARPSAPPEFDDLPAYVGTTMTDIDCNWKVCVEHLLGEGGDFHWPLLFVDRSIVRQVVPHTFLRTRLFTHVFGTGIAAPQEAGIKQACETLQASRASGAMPVESEFNRRVAEAYAGNS